MTVIDFLICALIGIALGRSLAWAFRFGFYLRRGYSAWRALRLVGSDRPVIDY